MKRRRKTIWIFPIVLAVVLCTPALATTINVDDASEGGGMYV